MISVVDDDPSVRRALQRLIRSWGFQVETFGSAQEFFDAGEHQQTECLVLDIHLGGMSGLEMYRNLMATGHPFPVIFITAHDDEQSFEQATQCGALAYLRKPFDDRSLMDAIRKAARLP